MLESYLDFPQCWNGRDLDSPDHKSHMAYPVNGDCPATHPVPGAEAAPGPALSGERHPRPASGWPRGGGFTMHGDFFNAWPVDEMARRVNDCIRPIIKCGADGHP